MVKENCGKDEPCIFKGRDEGWEVFREDESLKKVHLPKSKLWKSPNATIFLTISSYRDKLCPVTLFNLFTKASYPSRIFVGVVQQNTDADKDCFDTYCEMMKSAKYSSDLCPYASNVRMDRVNAADAKGPTWARARGSKLVEDEDFCMQTDSHMDFVHNWDAKMLEMWGQAGNEYAVLSTYVSASETLNENEEGHKGTNGQFEVPHLCMVTMNGMNGLVRNWGTKCMRNMPKPKLTNAIWGAGLSFSRCHAERKVPYDPHTPFIFDGEEFSRAMRLWTWGYDIYSPNRVFVVHNYHESQADPTHFGWASNAYQQKQKNSETAESSVRRLKMLLEMPHDNMNKSEISALQRSRYGLGDRRTLDQGIAFSGVDTKHRKSLGNYCGNLKYVPFAEHPWGPDYLPVYDPASEEFLDVRDPGSVYFDPSTRALWESADRLHREGKDHLAHLDAAIVKGASSGAHQQKKEPLGLPGFTINANDMHDTGSHRRKMSLSKTEVFYVNLVCITCILIFIGIRLGLQRRNSAKNNAYVTYVESMNQLMNGGDQTSNREGVGSGNKNV